MGVTCLGVVDVAEEEKFESKWIKPFQTKWTSTREILLYINIKKNLTRKRKEGENDIYVYTELYK